MRGLGLALALLAALPGAQAADPVRGAQLYANSPGGGRESCASCHGASPLTSNISKIYVGRNSAGLIQTAVNNNTGGMGYFNTYFGTNDYADIAAYLGNSPGSVAFAGTAVGATSTVSSVTVRASTSAALTGLTASVSGSDFALSGGTCTATLARGLTCTVGVVFKPTAAGARSGTLSISHSGVPTPVTVALSGTATGSAAAPAASLSTSALSFAATPVGSSAAAQTVTLSNSGTAALSIGSIATGSAEFPVAGGTCVAGGSVAAGGSCTVSLGFQPTATGSRSATLSIAHNATGSPSTVALSGTATAAAVARASLSSASLSFGSVTVGQTGATQTLTLSNTGTAAMVLGTLTDPNAEFRRTGGSCSSGASVAAGGSCTLTLAFTPAAAGARSATLSVPSNATNSPVTASLSGSGVAATPLASASPTGLVFTQAVGSTSAAQTVTLSNSGTAPLTLGSLTLGGSQAGEFSIGGGSSCVAGGTVAAGASCTVLVGFTPAASGARSASLSIAHNATGSPTVVSLAGTGSALPVGTLSLNAASLSFGPVVVGGSAAGQTVTASNTGAAPISFSSLALSGTAAADFSRSGSCSTGTPLAAGASCTLVIGFTPSATGARSATLTLSSNASNGSAAISLAGSGTAAPTPAVALSPAALDFGSQTVSTAATARSVQLSNTGSAALSIASITAASPFSVSNGCGSSLAAGASCTLSIGFTPTATGAATGSVVVTTNAAGSPHQVALAGSGVASVPALSWVPATTAVAFGESSVGGASVTRTLSLRNAGPGSVTLQAPVLTGAQAADFSLATGNACNAGTVLVSGASCSLVIGFSPRAAGSRSGTLAIASNGSAPGDVALSGTGVAVAAGAVELSASALSFSSAGSAGQQTFTLRNSGAGVLAVQSVAIASGNFSLGSVASGGCAAAPFSLQPGQSCALGVLWQGGATGTGSLELQTSASGTPTAVALSASTPVVRNDEDDDDDDDEDDDSKSGGGCSVAPHAAADPMLPLMLAAAAGVLLWRRRVDRRQRRSAVRPCSAGPAFSRIDAPPVRPD